MKVSLVHPERRCAQHLVLDVVTPAPPTGYSTACERPADPLVDGADPFPCKLMPTQRFNFSLAPGARLAFVASAAIKSPPGNPFGDLSGLLGPLVIELEAEEGEALHDDLVRVFRLDAAAAALVSGDSAAFMGLTDAHVAHLNTLVQVPAPVTRAGDRQQFGMLTILVHPARDLLIAIAHRDARA